MRRGVVLTSAALMLYPGGAGFFGDLDLSWANLAGLALFAGVVVLRPRRNPVD